MASYTSLKVADLKGLLQERGLPVSGTKNELIARLEGADKNAKVDDPTQETEAQQPAAAAAATTPATATTTAADKGNEKEKTVVEIPDDNTNPSKSADTKSSNADASSVVVGASVEDADAGKSDADIVIEELQHRSARQRKWGENDAADENERLIKRIKKYGVVPNSPEFNSILKTRNRLPQSQNKPKSGEDAEKIKARQQRFAGKQ